MTVHEIKLRRLGAQYLWNKTDSQTAVRGLCGFQAQFLSNALHAMRLRCSDFDECIHPTGLCKNWTIRGTVHVFSEADLGLFVRADGGRLYRSLDFSGYTFWNQRDVWSLTPARQRYFSEVILDVLSGGAMTRDALKAVCRAHGMDDGEESSMFDQWGGGIRELCERGFMHYTVTEEKTFCLTPLYTPMTEDAAELELAKRYFTNYGPASIHDCQYFFHTTAAKIKGWLNALPVQSTVCEGKTYYWIENPIPPAETMPACVFLAGFDPLMLGYEKKESLFLPQEYLRGIFNLAGIVMPAILLDGRVVGRWKYKNRSCSVTLFEDTSDNRRIISAYAEQIWSDLRKIVFSENETQKGDFRYEPS